MVWKSMSRFGARRRVAGSTGIAAAALICVLSTDARGQTVEVPADFPTIQAAIDAAAGGEEIVVAPGIYNEVIDFLGKAITVRSSDGPATTTIDGSSVAAPVVQAVSGETPNSILEGFTITGGEAPSGAGMLVFDSNPKVRDCVFFGNTASQNGGALCCSGFSLVTVTDCAFRANEASEGGAVCVSESGTVNLVRCDFQDNTALVEGGAIRVSGQSTVTLTNGNVVGNEAQTGDGGGARVSGSATLSLINCLVTRNQCGGSGSAIRNSESVTTILAHCTISQNLAATDGALRTTGGSNVTLVNSIVWGNGVNPLNAVGSSVIVSTYSNVEGGLSGLGNLDVDPQFVDPVGPDGQAGTGDENFRLSFGSPSIDTGDNASIPIDRQDLDADGNTTEMIPLDLDGAPRIENKVVDMGAYEFGGTPPPAEFIRGDADGNGTFNGLPDGLFVLSFQFLPGSPFPPCMDAADADDTGDINGLVDGLLLLSFQFVPGSPAPPAPGPLSCGEDPTDDTLGCANSLCP